MKGFRTRLKGRVFCIRDKEGTNLALVQLDLAFGSLVMHHQIAEEIASKTDIPISNIVLTCTHTHSGPTGFCSNDFYNRNAGALPGFEPQLYSFLTNQIIDGILEAHSNMKPAKIATGQIEIKGITRNRAIMSYIRNKGNEQLDPSDPKLIFEAINPNLYMIRVDVLDKKNKYKPLGAFSTFSIHGTGVGDRVDVFNADVFGFAERDLEWMIEEKYQPKWEVIHALCNGTEGDIAPNLPFYKDTTKETRRVPVDWIAARGIGKRIAQKAWQLFEGLSDQLKEDVNINIAAREINISENNEIDGIQICKQATIGAATVGGAYENRSVLTYILDDGTFMTQRARAELRCQGKKKLFAAPLMQLFNPPSSYPKNVMFQLIQIDDFLLVPLPWEVTITAGERINNKIIEAYTKNKQNPPKYISIASLSNDYMSYATTPEEYSYQAYEGGQTIYGPNTVPYIAAQLFHLTDDLLKEKHISEFPKEWNYDLITQHYYPSKVSNLSERMIVQQPIFKEGNDQISPQKEAYWFIEWQDLLPIDFKMHQSVIQLEKSENGQDWLPVKTNIQPIDDEGYDIEVRIKKKKKGHAVYMAKWYNPELEEAYEYRFRILKRNEKQPDIFSKEFR